MQEMYVYFADYDLDKRLTYKRILQHVALQNFSVLPRFVVEIWRFQFDAYRVILTEVSDIKLY